MEIIASEENEGKSFITELKNSEKLSGKNERENSKSSSSLKGSSFVTDISSIINGNIEIIVNNDACEAYALTA